MLKQRILSVLILMPIFIYITLFTQAIVFEISMLLIIGIAAWEWGQFAYLNKWNKIIYAFFIMLLSLFMLLNGAIGIIPWISITFLCWVFVIPWFIKSYSQDNNWKITPSLNLMLGCLLLTSFCLATVFLYRYIKGSGILMLLMTIWCADSAAYFIGRKWGKRKLAEQVSPNKTLEGMIGGIACALCIAAITWWLIERTVSNFTVSLWLFMSVSLLALLYSVLGDLFESMLKRMCRIKDSSQLIPGHGGVLDRIDSWIPAMVMWTVGLFWLGDISAL